MRTKNNKKKGNDERKKTLNNRDRLKTEAREHLQVKILEPLENKLQTWLESLSTSSVADHNTLARMQHFLDILNLNIPVWIDAVILAANRQDIVVIRNYNLESPSFPVKEACMNMRQLVNWNAGKIQNVKSPTSSDMVSKQLVFVLDQFILMM